MILFTTDKKTELPQEVSMQDTATLETKMINELDNRRNIYFSLNSLKRLFLKKGLKTLFNKILLLFKTKQKPVYGLCFLFLLAKLKTLH